MKYLFVILLFVGCGQFQVKSGVYTDNDEFIRLTQEYLYYKQMYLGLNYVEYPIIIQFGELDLPAVGRCTKYADDSYGVRYITFDRYFWQYLSDDRRLLLLIHEMGHCDLNFPHQDDEVGIMNEMESVYYIKKHYIENFFLNGW